MRMKGRKPIFNRNDTYSLCHTLEPIICAGLKKFKQISTEDEVAKEWGGVPSKVLYSLFPDGGDIDKHNFSEDKLEQGSKEWHSIIDKMIYAFENKVPCCSDYDFEFVSGERDGLETEDGFIEWDKVPSNQEEYDRLRSDEASHEDKVKEGLDLFSVYYHCLWW